MPGKSKKPTSTGENPENDGDSQKPKNLGGRPTFKVTAENSNMVKALAMFGMAHHRIAEALDISLNTLTKHFSVELREARPHLIAKSMGVVYNALTDKDTGHKLTAAKFVLGTQGKELGWTTRIEMSLRRDLFAGLDFSRLASKDLDELHRILVKAGAPIEQSDIPQGPVPKQLAAPA